MSKTTTYFYLSTVFNFFERRKILYWLMIISLSYFGYYTVRYMGLDFKTYFKAAVIFHQGGSAYLELMHVSPYYYPPLTTQLLAPFSSFPYFIVFGFWFFFSVLAIALAVKLLAPDGRKLTYSLIAFGFLPVANTLYTGQVEAFLLLALVFAYILLKKNKPIFAGFTIAIGIMLKIIPVAHWCYFIFRKKWWAAMGVVFGLVILFLLSLPFIGWQGWLDFFQVAGYFGNPPSMHAVHFEQIINNGSNQALSGFIARLITNDELAIKVWRIAAIILVMATAWVLTFSKKQAQDHFDLEFSLVTITINLIMPYTWYHQYILFLIPIFILLKRIEIEKSLSYLCVLGIGYVLTDFQGVCWHHLHNNFLTSLPLFFGLSLWGLLAKEIFQPSALPILATASETTV